jgi:hypothetical protein
MADFKKLHEQWKKAKKEAKDWYGNWEKIFMDVSRGHEDVKFGAPPFPAFKKDLGPSLDNIQAKKDVKKYKEKADAAVKQYKVDIKKAMDAVGSQTVPTGAKNGPAISRLASDKLQALEDLRGEIEKELKSVKV